MGLLLMTTHSSCFFYLHPDEILLSSHNSRSLSLIPNDNIASLVTKSKCWQCYGEKIQLLQIINVMNLQDLWWLSSSLLLFCFFEGGV